MLREAEIDVSLGPRGQPAYLISPKPWVAITSFTQRMSTPSLGILRFWGDEINPAFLCLYWSQRELRWIEYFKMKFDDRQSPISTLSHSALMRKTDPFMSLPQPNSRTLLIILNYQKFCHVSHVVLAPSTWKFTFSLIYKHSRVREKAPTEFLYTLNRDSTKLWKQ